MRTDNTVRNAAYSGSGMGLVLFAIKGLLPGSFIGGAIGLNIAGSLFGTPLSSALLPRMIVGVSMLLGVFLSALIFITCLSLAGWVTGHAIDALRADKTSPAEIRHS